VAKNYRLGVIGFAHMHVNTLLDRFAELPNVEWVACADTVPDVPSPTMKRSSRGANLKRAQEVTGIPKVYADYRRMLEQERFDIVIFCPENARHGEVGEAVAAAGAHMVTEKPMADSLSGALRLARAAQANDVALMVNWPTTWQPAIRALKEQIDRGDIGDVWEVKWRNGASMGPLSYHFGEDAFTDAEKGAEWWHQAAPGAEGQPEQPLWGRRRQCRHHRAFSQGHRDPGRDLDHLERRRPHGTDRLRHARHASRESADAARAGRADAGRRGVHLARSRTDRTGRGHRRGPAAGRTGHAG
jgi:hypothetical protein